MLQNHTPSPALSYDGIDGIGNVFGVIVCRQTYEWNDKGLLVLSKTQDPLCFTDELVDDSDMMKGVRQESDLCEYKPKCDVLVLGNAYAPSGVPTQSFVAKLMATTPDSYVFFDAINAPSDKDGKTIDAHKLRQKQILETLSQKRYTLKQGVPLIDKTLAFLGVQSLKRTVLGDYEPSKITPVSKVSLDTTNGYGGFVYIPQSHPESDRIPKDKQPSFDPNTQTILNADSPVLYYNQCNHNPYGTGFIDKTTLNIIKPDEIALPQIANPRCLFDKALFQKQIANQLSKEEQDLLSVGFGIRPKTHPDRAKLVGIIDDNFIQGDELLPDGFDFAVWNAAYPDQQCDYLKGNEWLTLVNLCKSTTKAAYLDKEGNCHLKLYLPENTLVAYVEWDDGQMSEIPLKIDTLIIRPDDSKVNMVWRIALDKTERQPTNINLVMLDKKTKDDTIAKYFAQKGTIVRPYEENGI